MWKCSKHYWAREFIWLGLFVFQPPKVKKNIYRFFSLKYNQRSFKKSVKAEKFRSVSQDIFRERFPSQGQRYFQPNSFCKYVKEIFWGLLVLVKSVIRLDCGRNTEAPDMKRRGDDDVHSGERSCMFTRVFQSQHRTCQRLHQRQTKRQTGWAVGRNIFFNFIIHKCNTMRLKHIEASLSGVECI